MYREAPPPPPLRQAVRCVWWSVERGPKRIVPDGCADLVVAPDQVFVAGPDTGPWESALSGVPLFGLRFRPGHAPRVLGVAADELADQRVPVADVWGRGLADRLLQDPGALADVVAGMLAQRRDTWLDPLIARLDAGAPRVSAALTDLGGVGLGQRQLRRRFTVAVGYGPATYLRVARLQRAVALARSVPGLSALAAAAGYADQAHLSRDCRELTGLTPGAYFGTGVRSVQDEPRQAA